MKKRTKICFFINTLRGGGAEKVLVDLVNHLDKEQYEVTLVTLLHGVYDSRLQQHVKHRTIINSTNGVVCNALMRLYCKILPLSLFSRLFLKHDCDVLIAYSEGFPARAVAAANFVSKKIAFVHCNTGVDSRWLVNYKTPHDCLKEFDTFSKVCFVSKDSLEGFQQVVGHLQNACVVHNFIDFNTVLQKSLAPLDISYSTKGLKIISVGRLMPIKGYERLLKAVARLQSDNYNFELWICGDGEERTKLEAFIKKENITCVRLLGFQDNPYKYMSKADLYVCPSLSEAYSTSVAESVALGIPVLTTDCSGMREILKDGEYGDIVENSEEGLYNGLKNFLTNTQHFVDLKSNVTSRSNELLSTNPLMEYYKLFDEIS